MTLDQTNTAARDIELAIDINVLGTIGELGQPICWWL